MSRPFEYYVYSSAMSTGRGGENPRSGLQEFEHGRIRQLQEERLHIQKKTFTKWMNSYLSRARMEVNDLFVDLCDGKRLMKLLEIISGERLGKPNNGKMTVHKIENVNKCLTFLHTKVRLESIGAEDIVSGNRRLILGLIWTIILRFVINDIKDMDSDDEDKESNEKKSAKEALLLWCQRKTRGYAGVHISDFSNSWRNGMGFNALIHSHRPDLFDFSALDPTKSMDNLNHAFEIAHRELGVPKLLDAEDLESQKPDEKSVMTYVASYYHTFFKMKEELTGGRRIANIVGRMMEADNQKKLYETVVSDLLAWIQMKITWLESRNYAYTLEGIQKELITFKEYRTVDKPPKYSERAEMQALLFGIQAKLKSLGQPLYTPPEGKQIYDIEKAWELLEAAEHKREVALKDELLRQRRLENMAHRFYRKSTVRDNYLNEMITILSDPRYGSNVTQKVEATIMKHEAISADIVARKDRFENLTTMSDDLVKENYHAKDAIKQRHDEVIDKWNQLLQLLEGHRGVLNSYALLMNTLRDIAAMLDELKEFKSQFSSAETGRHLMENEDLIHKHAIANSQVLGQRETLNKLEKQAKKVLDAGHGDKKDVEAKLEELHREFKAIASLAETRKERLMVTREYFRFVAECEELEQWLLDKQRICQSFKPGRDIVALVALQQKHKALEAENKAAFNRYKNICRTGEDLCKNKHPMSSNISAITKQLDQHFDTLNKLSEEKRRRLEDAYEGYRYHADANEAESYMREVQPLLASADVGKDEQSAQASLKRHLILKQEISAYKPEIQKLRDHVDRMVKNGVLSNMESVVEEEVCVAEEEPVWETVTKTLQPETVERLIPQVEAMYPYEGNGMQVLKGEVLTLLNKSHEEWWSVRKADGQEGFVPANYVREIEPKKVTKVMRNTLQIQERKPVKKTVIKKQVKTQNGDMGIETRQRNLESTYTKVCELADIRQEMLNDSIKLLNFFGKCNDFEQWMKDKETAILTDVPGDSVQARKTKFENFVTDLSASKARVNEIEELEKNFVAQRHPRLADIRKRAKQIKDHFAKLNDIKKEKEKSLDGASLVEIFYRAIEEQKEWMAEKIEKMDSELPIGSDMKTVNALQRRHEALERELHPIKDRVVTVFNLGDSVSNQYPSERRQVEAKKEELRQMWEKVEDSAQQRKAKLEASMGHQVLKNSTKDLLQWIAGIKTQLNQHEPANDVQTAEELLKQHEDLLTEITARSQEFRDIDGLGNKLRVTDPSVDEILAKLATENEAIRTGYLRKLQHLRQSLDLQLFLKEANQIDTTTAGHVNVIQQRKLGESLDEVENILKNHDNLINTLLKQDEKVRDFSLLADRLIEANHCEKKKVGEARDGAVGRRQACKDEAFALRQKLLDSREFQIFKADADDMSSWITAKARMASDESYRDLGNLQRRLKKHEAFQAELKANRERIATINDTGKSLINNKHFSSDEIERILEKLNNDWQKLNELSDQKCEKLIQADTQKNYNKYLDDAQKKLDDIERKLDTTDIGDDLRSAKDKLAKQQAIENEIAASEAKVNELVAQGDRLAEAGHFDSGSIQQNAKILREKLNALKLPAEERRAYLTESVQLHQCKFDLETEYKWIEEHIPPQTSKPEQSNSLMEAQNAFKKHEKLSREVQAHQPLLEKSIKTSKDIEDGKARGDSPTSRAAIRSDSLDGGSSGKTNWKDLIDALSKDVGDKRSVVERAWDRLQKELARRKAALQSSLKAQKFYNEVHEMEQWIEQKTNVLTSSDVGRDEDAAVKLLSKHQVFEIELDSYNAIVNEMANDAQQMVDQQHPEAKTIANKMSTLKQQLKNLGKLSGQRRIKLLESKQMHEFIREHQEIIEWIKDKMAVACVEDYGPDYEHLLELKAKFDKFELSVQAGEERYHQALQLAEKLAQNSSNAVPAQEKAEELQERWDDLVEAVEIRKMKLEGAGEIHRFNKDVADSFARIQEKYAKIPDDLGNSLKQVEQLIRNHDVFENDLVALETQLQTVVDDASRLQQEYQGGNAEQIRQKQQTVIAEWEKLKDVVLKRRMLLENSRLYQTFLSYCKRLETFVKDAVVSLNARELTQDYETVGKLMSDHQELRNEITEHEAMFIDVFQSGNKMIESGHYAAEDILKRIEHLQSLRDTLHQLFEQRNSYLKQLLDRSFFFREAKQIEVMCSQQEARLAATDYGNTVYEVDHALMKHRAFQKVLDAQDEKINSMKNHAEQLVKQNHFDSPAISQKLKEVLARRQKVMDGSKMKGSYLENMLNLAKFLFDAKEAQEWIEYRKKRIDDEVEASQGKITLEDKMKQLQKHQTFEAEVAAHHCITEQLQQKGVELLNNGCREQVAVPLDNLIKSWNSLLQSLKERGVGLAEAQDILEFNKQAAQVESWIRDKGLMIQAGDTGRDLEHCELIIRKLDDVDSDMKVDGSKIQKINGLADKLIASGHSGKEATQEIERRRLNINDNWKKLQGALSDYRLKLREAQKVHSFVRDLSETQDRIKEKMAVLSTEDNPATLNDVETLMRKQEAIEREVAETISKKLRDHENQMEVLIKTQVAPCHVAIQPRLEEVRSHWSDLRGLSENKNYKLKDIYEVHKFLNDSKSIIKWCGDMKQDISIDQQATNTAEAEQLLTLNDERKQQINSKKQAAEKILVEGQKLLDRSSSPSFNRAAALNKQIEEHINTTRDNLKSLDDLWAKRNHELTGTQQFLHFKEQVSQVESWLLYYEAFLNNEDIGDSMASVRALLTKHANCMNTMQAQGDRVEQFGVLVKELLDAGHANSDQIESSYKILVKRRDKMMQRLSERSNQLEESRILQMFLRNVYEAETWVNEKMQVAMDENYKDFSNLLSKIKKHTAFEAEVIAHQSRVDRVEQEGQQIIASQHFASQQVKSHIERVQDEWQQLLNEIAVKKTRLNDSYQCLLFNWMVEDCENFVKDIETQLSSEDYGRDLTTVEILLKKHAQLETSVQNFSESIERIKQQRDLLVKNDSYLSEEIEYKAQGICKKYDELAEPMQTRKENLEESLVLHQLVNDVDEELAWIQVKHALANSNDVGESLAAVQTLLKKHKNLENEVISHEGVVVSVCEKGENLVRTKHLNSETIASKVAQLRSAWNSLKESCCIRKLKLEDSAAGQQLLNDAAEIEGWIKEKLTTLSSCDQAKDENSVNKAERKVDLICRDAENFKSSVVRLQETSTALINRQHFDSMNIKDRVTNVEHLWATLIDDIRNKKSKLASSKDYFVLLRQTDDTMEWIAQQMQQASSDDYGNDVERVEMLIKSFDAFMSGLTNTEERVVRIVQKSHKLASENEKDAPSIKHCGERVSKAYNELKDCSNSRKEALVGAKHVHMFARNADELIDWMVEKDAVIGADEFGHDLETIQSHNRLHEGFERDLQAIKGQVEQILGEGSQLWETFPDARDHIQEKRDEVSLIFGKLQERCLERKHRLRQAEQVQTYFDEYSQLMAWLNEMVAIITADDLPLDVAGAEALIGRHNENKNAIDAKKPAFEQFQTNGMAIIKSGHFMSEDVDERMNRLRNMVTLLDDTWERRKVVYEENLDLRKFLRDADQLALWLQSREALLLDKNLGDSLEHVEELIKTHEDLTKLILDQEDKFQLLERLTLLEGHYKTLKDQEDLEKKRHKDQQLKQTDQRRILNARHRDYLSPLDEDRASGFNSSRGIMRTASQRSFDSEAARSGLRRTESMKPDMKKSHPRRTTSFMTRRRNTTVTKLKSQAGELPPSDMEGFLERKHDLHFGGKRAPVRSWKQYYVVLCGHVLAFFKDQQALKDKDAAASPCTIVQSKCAIASDYHKKKFVFRLRLSDGSEFLFAAQNEGKLQEWVNKISFHANLDPSQQLLKYHDAMRVSALEPTPEFSGSERSTPTNMDSMLNNSVGSVSPTPSSMGETSPDGNGNSLTSQSSGVQQKIQMFQQSVSVTSTSSIHSANNNDIINQPLFTNLPKDKGDIDRGSSNLSRTNSLPPGASAPSSQQSFQQQYGTLKTERSDSVISEDARSTASVKDKKKIGMFGSFFRKQH